MFKKTRVVEDSNLKQRLHGNQTLLHADEYSFVVIVEGFTAIPVRQGMISFNFNYEKFISRQYTNSVKILFITIVNISSTRIGSLSLVGLLTFSR